MALAAALSRTNELGAFTVGAITASTGFAGVDGIFRFLPDGRSERALAVIEIQAARNTVVSPAPDMAEIWRSRSRVSSGA